MICPYCEQENPAAARFCSHCGARQVDGETGSGAQGARGALERHSERRQITVLFCDLVGSTPLAEHTDPEDLRELLGRYHASAAEAISHYDGYVAQYLGDGLLAYFGYPRAHEDDADRAVRAALEIQERLSGGFASSRLRARIGIHTGLVVVGEVGNEAHRETLALGSTTNVAARVQAASDEGGVTISDVTYRLCSGVYARDLGRRRLKGLDEPLRIYAVDGVSGRRRRSGVPETPLFGRDRELARLRACLERASASHGQAVLMSGEPGIGKSRLSSALRREPTPRLWIDMACSPFTLASALRPVRALFEERFGLMDDAGRARGPQRVAEALAEIGGIDLAAVVPYVLTLLGLPRHDDYPLPAITPEQERERLMTALCKIVEALAARQLVVIAIEDLQWADPSTLEWVERVAAAVHRHRLLLLFTARPEWRVPSIERLETLDLTRLSPRPTLELIEALAEGTSLPASLKRQIAERSDGVPLFVEQLTRAIVEIGSLADLGDETGASSAGSSLIPATLLGLLTARLDRLGPAKRVAQVAATLGREFSLELLEALGEITPDELSEGVARLVEADLVQPLNGGARPSYRFKHALVQDTAYQSLLHSERRQIHARVAAALEQQFAALVASEPALVARHYAEARDFDRAAQRYRAAGSLASARYANLEAGHYFRLALESLSQLPDDDSRRQRELAIDLELGPPLIVSRTLDDEEVRALHERIASLCNALEAAPSRLPALLYLSRYYLRRGAVDDSASVGEALLGIARDANIPLLEAAGRLILGSCEISRSPASIAIGHLERALDVAASIHLPPPTSFLEPDLLAYTHANLGLALAVGGRFDAAAAQLHFARERVFALEHEPTRIFVLAFSTIAFTFMQVFEKAIAWGREALALAEGRGFHTSEAYAHIMVGMGRVALGDHAGIEECEAGLAKAIEVGFRGGLCQYLAAAAEAARSAGRYARAHELLDESRSIYEKTGEAAFAGRVHRTRGMVYLAQGEAAKAEGELRLALDMLNEHEAWAEALMAATELLRLAAAREDRDDARAALVRARARVAGGNEYRAQRAADSLLAETAAG